LLLTFCHPSLDSKPHKNRSHAASHKMHGTWLLFNKELLGKQVNEWTRNEGVLCPSTLSWDLPNSEHVGHFLTFMSQVYAKVPWNKCHYTKNLKRFFDLPQVTQQIIWGQPGIELYSLSTLFYQRLIFGVTGWLRRLLGGENKYL
jgi:hypothetical protein